MRAGAFTHVRFPIVAMSTDSLASAAHFPVPSLLEHLHGAWNLRRQITDRRAAATFTVDGTATWVRPENAADRRLIYYEEGLLSGLSALQTPTTVRASYQYLPGPRSSTAHVAFSDGRPFHDLDLVSGDSGPLLHACSPDEYVGRMITRGPHELLLEWHVRGPAKDYDAVTVLTRVHDSVQGKSHDNKHI